MGKAEGSGENWHGHVTAVTCSPQHRRLGLAASLMASLEEISEKKRCYFVDLFVRVSNQVAITMYKNLGYTVYRTVLQYYRYKKFDIEYLIRPKNTVVCCIFGSSHSISNPRTRFLVF